MSNYLRSAFALIILSLASAVNAQLVINEIDYDQPGGDTAEFVELYNAGAAPVDLTGYSLEFINGSGGGAAIYRTIALNPVMLAAGDYFVVCADITMVSNCDQDSTPNTNWIQNGAPDAVGLFDNTASLIDSVSYEGSVPGFVETSGAPADSTSMDGSISRAIDGVDTNNNSVDFVFLPITPGTSNSGGMMPVLVINEFDYDQPGTVDDAEFVELYNAGPGTVDLTGHTLEFINGMGAVTYDTIVLPSIMLAAGDYFVVCGDAANVANCDLDDGPDTNFLQDGAPDAIALYDGLSILIDSVSYEGDVPGFVETSGAPGDFGANGSIARAHRWCRHQQQQRRLCVFAHHHTRDA